MLFLLRFGCRESGVENPETEVPTPDSLLPTRTLRVAFTSRIRLYSPATSVWVATARGEGAPYGIGWVGPATSSSGFRAAPRTKAGRQDAAYADSLGSHR